MIYALYTPETGKTVAEVDRIAYNDEVFAEMAYEGDFLKVSSIPTSESIPQKDAILKVDTQAKKLVYEYVDRPLTQDEKIEQLEAKLKATQDALDAILLA
ncbi:hypothetical protein [Brevibacillus brevis]|uniref:hypothetical protein n=1 Tax=Brevibacillus brevis TaxID=1393 RepID=UPI000D10AE0F|nr:hypothetical protein [Brevibacillus brevis]PSJ66031.1 hypothetical protein C7J99_28685 [Brevibacillus brevis]RED27948.1 hypothetical protein DES34_109243 [Brevibacillus brevis]GEC88786.1 hypothetical protein BBR01nite_11170 [Brevibacillus brevis]VEF86986.1 Uncharacterised protein [Brevibacillus brevis]